MGKLGPVDFAEKLTESNLSGDLYFSQKQWNWMRDQGRNRLIGQLMDGREVEYTEMITLDMLAENPNDKCPVDDAVFLGKGRFLEFR